MCARVSLYKLFAQSLRTSEATGFGRNKGSREVKRFYHQKEKPEEWRSSPNINGYPVNTFIEPVQVKIMNALRLGERKMASDLLSRIGHTKHILIANNFVQLFEQCASIPDPLFAMEIWRTMEEKGVNINNECHALMILALCKGGYLEEAFNLMSNCDETSDLSPTLHKYNTLLRASAKLRSFTHADKCLDLMERHMVGKDETTYIQLNKLAVLQENLPAVHTIWKEYTRFYSFNLISLREFIWSFSKLGDIKAACEALKQMLSLVFIKKKTEKQMLNIPIPFYNNLESLALPLHGNDCMDHYKVVDFDLKEVIGVGNMVRNLKSTFVTKILKLSFTHVIRACARAKNHELAEKLFFEMQNLGIHASRGAYDGLIRVVTQTKGFHEGLKVLKLMQKENVKPRDSTLEVLSISCSESLELDLAEGFLDQMAECHKPYAYNAFLRACIIMDKPERGVHVFGKMKRLNVAPNIKTYEPLFSLVGRVNFPYENGTILSQAEAARRIRAIEDDMARNGIQHSYLSISNLLYALGSEGMISRLLYYLHKAENQYVPATPIYNTVLHSLVKAEEAKMAIKLFEALMSRGYLPNDATFSIMIDCCKITRSFKSAQILTAMSIRYGYPPNVYIYTSLARIASKLGDFGEILTLVNNTCLEGIKLDAMFFNVVLREAAYTDRIDVMEFVMKRMIHEKIPPDATTCSYVVSTYMDHGFYNTAIEALQAMSIHMLSEQDIKKNKNVFEENIIYSEDSQVESRVWNRFLDSENLVVALMNLRWCAMLGYPISWSTNDSPWLKRLSATNVFR